MRDFAEEVPNIGLDDVVHALLLDRSTQFIQTPMLAAPRPVAVAAVFEHRLIDGFQYPFHRQFDQLIFKPPQQNLWAMGGLGKFPSA